jgi:two-component system, NarL family, nitrate/nitrite response regulator NarL
LQFARRIQSAHQAVPIRILIADAHPVVLAGLQSILSKDPEIKIVGSASDAAELVDRAIELNPDVLLFDPKLQEPAGPPLARTLRGFAPQAKLVLFAGTENKPDFPEAIRAGCSGVLLKEGPVSLIAKSIQKVYAGEIWIDSNSTNEIIQKFAGRQGHSRRVREPRDLTPREREIVSLIACGHRNPDIADKLSISEQTVKNHISKIFQKLNVSDRLELALYAVHHNLHESLDEPSGTNVDKRQITSGSPPTPIEKDTDLLCSAR